MPAEVPSELPSGASSPPGKGLVRTSVVDNPVYEVLLA